MYRLYHHRPVSGDILFVLIDPEKKADRTVRNGEVAAIYAGKELIGINLFNASEVYAWPDGGMIPLPSRVMIDALNKALVGAGLSPLAYPESSGYRIASISKLEEHPLDEKAQIVSLSLGETSLSTVSAYPNLTVGAKVVVALDGTILYDGSVFHKFVSRNIPSECALQSASELLLKDQQLGAYLPKEGQVGSDFFAR